MFKRHKKSIALALLLTVTPAMSGCFGSFGATRLIWEINRDLFSNKILQWIVFLIFTAFPVYGIAVTVDVFFLNLLEFWTGSNLLVEKGEDVPERVVQLGDDTLMVMNRDGYNKLSFELIQNGEAASFALEMERDSAKLTHGSELVGLLQADPDGLSVYDSEGKLLDSMTSAQADSAVASYETDGSVGLVDWNQARHAVQHGVATR